MTVDPAILAALGLASNNVSQSSIAGGDSSASASRITATLDDGTTKSFFVKMGSGKDAATMFRGEYASLRAIHAAVPTLCPAALAQGPLSSQPNKHFLLTEYLHLGSRGSAQGASLAQKLAKLHTTPAPPPPGHTTPKFGFPETTCCGDTPQPNTFTGSWAAFYAEHRLRFILAQSERNNGRDAELRDLVTKTADVVVPRLLGDAHLNNGKGVVPVVVHGDLWSGNAGVGRIGEQEQLEHVVYDPSACYAHSEFELGIMKMFGGFRGDMDEYHRLVPKTEPVEEYEDRVALYEVYHHLNHNAMFGGSYRSGAVAILSRLVRKYGSANKGEL